MTAKIRAIDTHVHLYPAGATANVKKFMAQYPIPADFIAGLPKHFDASHYLAHAAPYGVVAAVNLPVAPRESSPRDVSRLNESCAKMMADYPGRIFSFGALNPHLSLSDIRTEVRRIRELGLLGIKFHPMKSMGPGTFQEFDPTEERFYPIYRAISDAGLSIHWHAGDPMADSQKFNATPPKLQFIKESFFADQRMYVGHLGGMAVPWEEVVSCLGDLEGVILDTAYEYFQFAKVSIDRVVSDIGDERIFWSSDFPYMGASRALEGFAAMGTISEEARANILFNNAAREFGITVI